MFTELPPPAELGQTPTEFSVRLCGIMDAVELCNYWTLDQVAITRTHACGLRLERREGAFLKVFSIESFTLDITLSKFEASVFEALRAQSVKRVY